METLNDAWVFRCGATAPHYRRETRKVEVEPGLGYVKFYFTMASKGGGNTDVRLEVGNEDLPTLLRMIADVMASSRPEVRDPVGVPG